MTIMTKGGHMLERDFVEGDVVEMVSTDLVLEFGAVKTGDIGTVQMVLPDRLVVDFPTQTGWMGKREEFVLVRPAGGFKEGDIVEVTTNEPIYGSGGVSRRMVGRVLMSDAGELAVDITSIHPHWKCKEDEVALVMRELKPETPPTKFNVGDIVIGNEDSHYAITGQDVYCVVMENLGRGFIGVSLLDDDTVFTVEEKCFDYVTSIDALGDEIEEIDEALKVEREVLERLTTHVEQLGKLKKAAKGGLHDKIERHLIEKDFLGKQL